MKLATAEAAGRVLYGIATPDGLIDLTRRLGSRCTSLAHLLGDGELLHQARTIAKDGPVDYRLDALTFLPPLTTGTDARTFALGVAYKDHQIETGRASQDSPSLFMKDRESLVGHGHRIVKPAISQQYDFEGEIVIVIGRGGRNIAEADAQGHIAGYSIMMDGSVRDYQKHSVTAGKNFDRSSALGPWVVTADEIADPGAMQLTTRLNGTIMQSTTFDQLMWTPAFIVHYISTFTALRPGDAISTGTPAGVGHRRNPQLFMKAGDRLEIEVSGIGTLSNTVTQE